MRKRHTDTIIPLVEMAVKIIDLTVVFGVIDVKFERVNANDGS